MIEHLERRLQFAQDDSPEAKLDKLERGCRGIACHRRRWCRCLPCCSPCPCWIAIPPYTRRPSGSGSRPWTPS